MLGEFKWVVPAEPLERKRIFAIIVTGVGSFTQIACDCPTSAKVRSWGYIEIGTAERDDGRFFWNVNVKNTYRKGQQ